jgi:hypothetical protein
VLQVAPRRVGTPPPLPRKHPVIISQTRYVGGVARSKSIGGRRNHARGQSACPAPTGDVAPVEIGHPACRADGALRRPFRPLSGPGGRERRVGPRCLAAASAQRDPRGVQERLRPHLSGTTLMRMLLLVAVAVGHDGSRRGGRRTKRARRSLHRRPPATPRRVKEPSWPGDRIRHHGSSIGRLLLAPTHHLLRASRRARCLSRCRRAGAAKASPRRRLLTRVLSKPQAAVFDKSVRRTACPGVAMDCARRTRRPRMSGRQPPTSRPGGSWQAPAQRANPYHRDGALQIDDKGARSDCSNGSDQRERTEPHVHV